MQGRTSAPVRKGRQNATQRSNQRHRSPERHPGDARAIHDLRDGEKVVMLRRRHPSVMLRWMLWPILLSVLWVALSFFLLTFTAGPHPDPLISAGAWPPAWLPGVLWVVWLGLGGVALMWFAYVLLDWCDHWIALTTRRLIIMDKTLLLHETRREAPLAKVQNVVADYPNALSMSLDFGNLTVDTAGIGVLTFKGLPQPKAMREAIFAQQVALRSGQAPPEERRKAAVRAMLLGADPAPAPPHRASRSPGRRIQPARSPSVADIGFFAKYLPMGPQRVGASITWHKHWLFLVRGILWPVLFCASGFVGWLISLFVGEPGSSNPIAAILGWGLLLLFPACAVWALWNWEDWRNDLYKLDHERVYDIESLPFGMREQSKETLITRITDVSYVVPGPLANLLNFGDVIIKTPGESTEFVFRRIPCPREVQQEIMARVDEYRLKDGASVDREIEAWIKTYHDVTRGA